MKGVAKLVIAGAISAGVVYPSYTATLNTMDDVGAAIQACWTPPADAGNSTVTLSFSFKRDGSLIGPPRPTAAKVAGDDKARKEKMAGLKRVARHRFTPPPGCFSEPIAQWLRRRTLACRARSGVSKT